MDYFLMRGVRVDSAKSDECFADRGFDFAYAARAFLDPGRDVFLDSRWDYGEDRYVLRGLIDGRLFVVVFTYRRGAIRIISA
ncbi:MAG: BrnT family toxin [Spirochaetota bacterium]